MNENQTFQLPDRRTIGFAEYGDLRGAPVFALHGTPGSRFMFQLVDESARQLGLRVIAPERPGYGLSSKQAKRGLSDWPTDIAALADHLSVARFAVVGVSGGGPYAAACAACLGERITHTGIVSPIGPIAHPQMAGQLSRLHKRLFVDIATSGWRSKAMFRSIRWSVRNAPTLALRSVMQICPSSDRAILRRPEVAANLLESTLEGLRGTTRGGEQDLRLYSQPWDFAPETISRSCRLWQGTADTTVPVRAAELLAELIPGCELTRLPGAGHYWVYAHFADVLAWVAAPEAEPAER